MKLTLGLGIAVIVLAISGHFLYKGLVKAKLEYQSLVVQMEKIETGIATMQTLAKEDQEKTAIRLRNLNASLKEIQNYAQDTSIARVSLPSQWVWIHDVQALGLDPASAAARDLQAIARPANDIEVMGAVSRNYANYQTVVQQLVLCQNYARQVQEGK
jgi:hypothetical protein